MKFPHCWVEDVLPPHKTQEEKVYKELEFIFANLGTAEQLMFHTIFLTDDIEGPIVMAYGKEGENMIYLHYIAETEWVKFKE